MNKIYEVEIHWKKGGMDLFTKFNNYEYSENYLILESKEYEQQIFNLLEINYLTIRVYK